MTLVHPLARPETAAARQTALVVESDPSSLLTLRNSLSALGFQVTMVSCGVDAVIAARRSPPAVIFVAIQLRDVTGEDLVTWLRANPALASVPIVAMYSLGNDPPELKRAGFDALLRKPTTAAKITQAIEDVGVKHFLPPLRAKDAEA